MVHRVKGLIEKVVPIGVIPKTPKRKPLNESRLIVGDDVSFVWKGETITKQQLDEQFNLWRGCAIIASIGADWRKNERLAMLATLYEDVPFTLTTSPNTKFEVQFQCFPYMIDGDDGFQEYSLRLVPVGGRVVSIGLREEANVAINLLKVTQEKLLADTGNGSLRLEIYFKPAEANAPLTPSHLYCPKVVIPQSLRTSD